MCKKRTAKTLASLAIAFTLALLTFTNVYANDVDVEGEIGIQDPDSYVYSVSFSSGVNWYVTEYSSNAVWNTKTQTNMDNPNSIVNTNNSGIAYKVTLDSFELGNNDATAVADDLSLYLTGALAADSVGAIDLSEGESSIDTTYTNLLNPGASSQWTYGFSGTYDANLTSTTYNPTYVMTISFGIAD